ncbi:MAG TPA: hypothetical protein VIH85_15430 [Solirubrobacteraceae bacterium]
MRATAPACCLPDMSHAIGKHPVTAEPEPTSHEDDPPIDSAGL